MTYRVLAAASAVALLALLVAGCGGGGGATLTKQTLTFTERQNDNSASFVDNPPKSAATGDEPKLSPSDQLTFTADMLDRSGKDVGDLDASCTVTATATGSFDDSHAQCVRGAVVGGTGDYAGATGSFTSSDENGTDKPSQDTFRLFIPKQ